LFLAASFILPLILGSQISRVPYSLFIHQAQAGEVAQVQIGQNQIQFQLKTGDAETRQLFSKKPIFDLGDFIPPGGELD
jgi:cell division protease FtsH